MPSLLQTLEQTEYWYGQDGFPYRLTEMEQSHRINVLAFLRRRARNIYERHQWAELKVMETAPDDVFAGWEAENERRLNSDPVEWLNSMPLMQELERLVKAEDTIDGEVVTNEVATTQPSPPPGGYGGLQLPWKKF